MRLTTWQLLGEFYRLGGVAWDASARRATFRTRAAARAFKRLAPGWTVCYYRAGKGEQDAQR